MSSVSSQTAYTDMTVQSGKNYDYVVKSVDSSGVESTPSNTTTVAIP
jgi:fibronectin type 3 domain-containing protein